MGRLGSLPHENTPRAQPLQSLLSGRAQSIPGLTSGGGSRPPLRTSQMVRG